MPKKATQPRSDEESTLDEYKRKRDFGQTAEPAPARRSRKGLPTFVVQKHAARQLHYDFRLEVDGALKSWPVPRGPSLDPKDKRMAVMVEDHPLDYASFEGVIPRGQYGAGQVIVWDNGTYVPEDHEGRPIDKDEADEAMLRGLKEGKLAFTLRGEKLKGSWTLVKTKRGENEWLLIKHQDGFVDTERDVTEDGRSVISGLTIEDIKAGRLPDRSRKPSAAAKPSALHGAKRMAFPSKVAPMLATLTERPFTNRDWLFEPKLDGVRTIALIHDGRVKLLSRRGLDATKQYPSTVAELAQQDDGVVLDGEIVAFDDEGRPSFEEIQQRLNLSREADIRKMDAEIPVHYYVFDLLYADGHDLRGASLQHRKELLERLLVPTDNVHYLDHIDADGEAAYDGVVELGLEGIIAKHRASQYESGRQSNRWLKIKATLEDEFVVGGFSEGQGGRSKTFGALLLGTYDDDGKLRYAGHVGSGFDDRTLEKLRKRLDALTTGECPFVEPPQRSKAPWTRSSSLKGATTWVKPELVAQVKFAQRTRDGYLRAPVFLGLRDDKLAKDVRVQEMAPAPEFEEPAANSGEASDRDVAEVLSQLDTAAKSLSLQVQGHKIALTNLDKEMWPKLSRRKALTKRDFLVFLARVSPYALPHLRDRPLTLTRYPNGIKGKYFYQKHWEHGLPEFVETVVLFSEHNLGDQEYLICNNLPTLLWLGQLADLELHTWYSRVNPEPDGHHLTTKFGGSMKNMEGSLLNYPDFMVFDLDPYMYSGKEAKGAEPELNRKAFRKTCDVAMALKDVLDSLSLSSFVKTTGQTGLHIYTPILRQLDYAQVRAGAETIGRFLLQQRPRDITMEWSVEKRTGKIFFDHNQNVRGKTLASIYSARVAPEAAVSTPLRWEELGDVYPTDFTITNVVERLEDVGDLWANILDAKHDIQALLGA